MKMSARQGLLGHLFIYAEGAFTDHAKNTYPATFLHFCDYNRRLSGGQGYGGTRQEQGRLIFGHKAIRALMGRGGVGEPQTAMCSPK
jgi:hypothetical protein